MGTNEPDTNKIEIKRLPVRQPQKGVASYRVRLRGVAKFRRVGIDFTTQNTPYDLSRADIEAEAVRRGAEADTLVFELLNTPTLDVEEGATSRGTRDK